LLWYPITVYRIATIVWNGRPFGATRRLNRWPPSCTLLQQGKEAAMRRNGKEKWSGVEGQVSLEADTLNDRSRAAIALLRSADPDERQFDELEVNFESSGYSDPGRYDGAWENCYPAEYEDERIVTDVFLTTAGQKIRVADHVMLVVERDPLVQAEVAKVELEFPGPDYDAMYEAALERKRGW